MIQNKETSQLMFVKFMACKQNIIVVQAKLDSF